MAIGDKQNVRDLYGSPKCPHTNAVLIAAGERGRPNCRRRRLGSSSSVRA